MARATGERCVMQRRILVGGALALPFAVLLPDLLRPSEVQAADAPAPPPVAFDAFTVRKLARELAAKPYQAADAKLPDALSKLNYDQDPDDTFRPSTCAVARQGPEIRGAVLSPRLPVRGPGRHLRSNGWASATGAL